MDYIKWPKEAKDCVITMKENDASYEAIMAQLKEEWNLDVSRYQLRRLWLRNSENEDSEKVDKKIEDDKKFETLRADAQYWKKLYTASIKKQSGFESIINTIKKKIPAIQNTVPVPLAMSDLHTEIPISAVAPLTDTHIGEVVNLEEMAGMNQYDMEIFSRRLYGWTNKIIELVRFRKKYVDVPRLYVPMIGDMVSGDIHGELLKTNSDNIMNQMINGANLIAQSMMILASFFPEVYVKGVVGNHGRMLSKPYFKEKYMNWDYILIQMVAVFCSKQTNIHFELPKSYLNVFEVEGRHILMMHGDSVNSWNGIPFYGIQRAISQLRQALQFEGSIKEDITRAVDSHTSVSSSGVRMLAKYFEYVMLGHFHTNDEMDIGTGKVFICGCAKGGDEYALGKLHTISKPEYILTFFHPKYGYISKDIIYLDQFDDKKSKFSSALPSIWADGIIKK